MGDDIILSDKQLSNSTFSYVINAPVDKIDIAAWLFGLSETEYCGCCSPDHISCGSTIRADGVPMAINVEMIGKTLMVQHYIAEVAGPSLCRLVSLSDAFLPSGRSRVQMIWTLSVEKMDDTSCLYTNSLIAHPTQEFLNLIAGQGLRFEQAAEARQHASCNHNRRETPLFAASIERAALDSSRRSSRYWSESIEPVQDMLGERGLPVVA